MSNIKAEAISRKANFVLLSIPVAVIVIACLFSFFPHYKTLYLHVIGIYGFVLFFIWTFSRSKSSRKERQKIVLFGHYAYALLLAIMLVKMSVDIKSYYEFTADKSVFLEKYENGDAAASLRLAYFYRDRKRLPRTIKQADTFFAYEKWLRIYLRDSIRLKNTAAAKQIKLLAKRHIRGTSGDEFTGAYHTNLGVDLYKGAHRLGDADALRELSLQLNQAVAVARKQWEIEKQKGRKSNAERLENRLRQLEKLSLNPVQ
jgi:uncharacterized membrane protein